jgi:hypothetical protein
MAERWLEVFVQFRVDVLAAGWQRMQPLIEGLQSLGPQLAPDQMTHKGRRVAISGARVDAELARSGMVELRRKPPPDVYYSWRPSPAAPRSPVRLYARMPMSVFDNDREAGRRVIDYVRQSAVLIPSYGWIHPFEDRALADEPHFANPGADDRVREVFWVTVLGTEMVEQLGRDRVLSAPAKVEDAGGALLLITSASPADALSEPARECQARVLAHLVDGIDFTTQRAALLRRSELLAPVQRDWDADLVELLEYVLLWEQPEAVRAKALELNSFRAAEVERWPSAESPPVASDAAAELASYEQLAESFVMGLHHRITGLQDDAPACLIALDKHFWYEDYSRRRDKPSFDSHLVPGLGAFVGQVLVNDLGGRWQPSRVRSEARVVVGRYAYAPFARAERYLKSKQAVLEHAMSKLYRVAERDRQ